MQLAYGSRTAQDDLNSQADEADRYMTEQARALSVNYPDMAEMLEPTMPVPPEVPPDLGVFSSPMSPTAGLSGLDYQMAERANAEMRQEAAMLDRRDFFQSVGIPNTYQTPHEMIAQNQANNPFLLKDVTGDFGTGMVYPAGVGPLGGGLGIFEGGNLLDAQGNPVLDAAGNPTGTAPPGMTGTSVDPASASYFRSAADNAQWIRRGAGLAGAEGLYQWDRKPTTEELYRPGGAASVALAGARDRYTPADANDWVRRSYEDGSVASYNTTTHMLDRQDAETGAHTRIAPTDPEWLPYMQNNFNDRLTLEQRLTTTTSNPQTPIPTPTPNEWSDRPYNDGSVAYYNNVNHVFVSYDPRTETNTEVYPDDPRWTAQMQKNFPDELNAYVQSQVTNPPSGVAPGTTPTEAPAEELVIEEDGTVWVRTGTEWNTYGRGTTIGDAAVGKPVGSYTWDAATKKWTPK